MIPLSCRPIWPDSTFKEIPVPWWRGIRCRKMSQVWSVWQRWKIASVSQRDPDTLMKSGYCDERSGKYNERCASGNRQRNPKKDFPTCSSPKRWDDCLMRACQTTRRMVSNSVSLPYLFLSLCFSRAQCFNMYRTESHSSGLLGTRLTAQCHFTWPKRLDFQGPASSH